MDESKIPGSQDNISHQERDSWLASQDECAQESQGEIDDIDKAECSGNSETKMVVTPVLPYGPQIR
jgi:hypothetical protein